MEVYVSVTQRTTGHGITANANRGHGTDVAEDLKKHGLRDIVGKVTHVQRSGRHWRIHFTSKVVKLTSE